MRYQVVLVAVVVAIGCGGETNEAATSPESTDLSGSAVEQMPSDGDAPETSASESQGFLTNAESMPSASDSTCSSMDVLVGPSSACSPPVQVRYYFNGTACEAWQCDQCSGSDCGRLFDDLESCELAYAQCAPPTGYISCSADEDCGSGLCVAGTCGASCLELADCAGFERCVARDPELCTLSPVVGPGQPPVEGPGACLPDCRADEDCEAHGDGLVCWSQACVRQLPECETNCEKIADSCNFGCQVISATPYYPAEMCWGTEPIVLGCRAPAGPITMDGQCVQTPDGVLYPELSGTYTAHLTRYGEFDDCEAEGQQTAFANREVCQ